MYFARPSDEQNGHGYNPPMGELDKKLQAWVRDGLSKSGKTARGLAKVLGVAPPRITDIVQGRRRVQTSEVAKIAAYLEQPPPSDYVNTVVTAVGRVRVMGRIEAGAWRDNAETPEETARFLNCVLDGRFPTDAHQAYEVASPASDGTALPGDYLICVPVDLAGLGGRRRLVVCRIKRRDLEAFALGEIVATGSGEAVRYLIPSDHPTTPVGQTQIAGRVIAIHRQTF